MLENHLPKQPLQLTEAQRTALAYLGVKADEASIEQGVRRWLASAGSALILVPVIFILGAQSLEALGWSVTVYTTIFFVVYCLTVAAGLYFTVRPDYHTPVEERGDWIDAVGGYWLLACTFAPLLGWLLTAPVELTVSNWQWLYAVRAGLSIALPVITAAALLRYVRGKGTIVMLVILVGITAIPVWSAWSTALDLWSGAVIYQTPTSGTLQPVSGAIQSGVKNGEIVLPHTGRRLNP